MAEKVAQQIKTSVLSITKWGKEKKDNRRLDIGYYNDMVYFSIAKPDAEGKFRDTKSIFFKNLNEKEWNYKKLYIFLLLCNSMKYFNENILLIEAVSKSESYTFRFKKA